VIDPQIAELMRPYLLPGERLTWTGGPPAGLRVTAKDILLIPFSLLWGGFALVWEGLVLSSGAPFFFPLFGVPFVLVGLYLIVGRFVFDAWVRGRTVYALSGRRALVLRRIPMGGLSSAPLDGQVRLVGQRNGGGTLEFGAPNPLRAFGGFNFLPALQAVAFERVADVMAVYALAVDGKGAAG